MTRVVDKDHHELREGDRVKADWPGAVGVIVRISDEDGEYVDGRAVGIPPRVFVKWDSPLHNCAGQEWQTEDFSTQPIWGADNEGYVSDELSVLQ